MLTQKLHRHRLIQKVGVRATCYSPYPKKLLDSKIQSKFNLLPINPDLMLKDRENVLNRQNPAQS